MTNVIWGWFRYTSALPVIFLAASACGADRAGPGIPIPHPMTMLLRAEPVHRELGLSAEQTRDVASAAAEVESPLWRLRDLPTVQRDQAAAPIVDALRMKLRRILTQRQIDQVSDPAR